MKNLFRYGFAVVGLGLFSACTMGDKGSEKVADSVRIDTSHKVAQPPAEVSDTTLIDSLQTDKGEAAKKK